MLIQGLSGGCLAASNAYLGERLAGKDLTAALNLTQSSARAGLIAAPAVIGALLIYVPAPALIIYLSLLPLSAFIISLKLLDEKPDKITHSDETAASALKEQKYLWPILLINFCYCLALVQTFPYFLPLMHRLHIESDFLIGILFWLPHFIYLCFAYRLKELTLSAAHMLYIGFLALMSSALLHVFATDLNWLSRPEFR